MSRDTKPHLRSRPGSPTSDHLRRRMAPGNAMAADVTQQGPSNAHAATEKGQSAEQQRDELLGHIRARLDVVKQAQRRELLALDPHQEREATRELGDSHMVEHTTPDPERWHRCTKLYRSAADALCRGDLPRGAGLLRSAEEAERAAYATTSAVVDLDGVALLDMPTETRRGVGGPLDNRALPVGIRNVVTAILATRLWSKDSPVRTTDDRVAEIAEDHDEENEDAERRRA